VVPTRKQELQAQIDDSLHEISRLSIELKCIHNAIVEEKLKVVEKDHELAVLKEVSEREKQKAKCYYEPQSNARQGKARFLQVKEQIWFSRNDCQVLNA